MSGGSQLKVSDEESLKESYAMMEAEEKPNCFKFHNLIAMFFLSGPVAISLTL